MTPDQARAELIAQLMAGGALDERWRSGFEQVPRHKFIPDTVWRVDRDAGGRLLPLHRAADPDMWLELAYRDAPVDTQVDDGDPPPEGGWEVTSSASQPSVVAEMLAALAVEPGMRVLEIGTGTGWNAALLAWRVGAENVVSVEIDPRLAAQARAALDRAGYGTVTVVAGDGAAGWPDAAPYDRLIATVGVAELPYPWVAQVAAGGRLVVPLTHAFHPPGLATLTVRGDGTAAGRLGEALTFMGMRGRRDRRPNLSMVGEPDWCGETTLHPGRWAGSRDAALAIGQRIGPGVHTHYAKTDRTVWLLDPGSGSWASVGVTPKPYPVRQAGPRRLYDEVRDAYEWWRANGKPTVADWRVTVGPDGQRLELASMPLAATA